MLGNGLAYIGLSWTIGWIVSKQLDLNLGQPYLCYDLRTFDPHMLQIDPTIKQGLVH